MGEMKEAYPLQWPLGKPRTRNPERSRFSVPSSAVVRDALISELELLGAKDVVISTNVPLRKDGLFYGNHREPDDPGVAVYFKYKGRDKCFACDKWDKFTHNIRAIEKTINALRGINRWGSDDMVEAAFVGFDALPAPGQTADPYSILGVSPGDSMETITRAFREAIKKAHPDAGGSQEESSRLNYAYSQIRGERHGS